MWRWHIENNVSQSALVPLLQLIVQVISVAGAHEISANVVAEVFPNTIFKLRKWFVYYGCVLSLVRLPCGAGGSPASLIETQKLLLSRGL